MTNATQTTQETQAKRLSSRNWVVVATLMGIAIESGLASPVLINFSAFLTVGPTWISRTSLYAMCTLLVIFPLIWPLIVSYYIKPKRIVSPLQIALGSWAVDTVATLFASSGIASTLTSSSPFQNPQAVYGDFLGFALIFWVLAFVMGLYESLAVSWLIGVDIEGMNSKTYSIFMGAEDVASVIQSEAFNQKWKRAIVIEPELLVVRWKQKTGETILLGLMRHPDAPQAKSLVATVAYNEGNFYISEDKEASDARDTIVNDLETRLRKEKPSAQFEEVERPKDLASTRLQIIARASAQSALSIGRVLFSELSNYLKVAIIVTSLALVLTPFGAYYKIGTFDYGSIAVVLFVTLVAELGLAVKDEVARRRALRKTWPPEEV